MSFITQSRNNVHEVDMRCEWRVNPQLEIYCSDFFWHARRTKGKWFEIEKRLTLSSGLMNISTSDLNKTTTKQTADYIMMTAILPMSPASPTQIAYYRWLFKRFSEEGEFNLENRKSGSFSLSHFRLHSILS